MACLKANQAQVSPACKAELASVRRKAREVAAACADDVQSYCADVKRGQGAVVRCLAANQATLAPECRTPSRARRRSSRGSRRRAARTPESSARGIPHREGRLLACLSRRSRAEPGLPGHDEVRESLPNVHAAGGASLQAVNGDPQVRGG